MAKGADGQDRDEHAATERHVDTGVLEDLNPAEEAAVQSLLRDQITTADTADWCLDGVTVALCGDGVKIDLLNKFQQGNGKTLAQCFDEKGLVYSHNPDGCTLSVTIPLINVERWHYGELTDLFNCHRLEGLMSDWDQAGAERFCSKEGKTFTGKLELFLVNTVRCALRLFVADHRGVVKGDEVLRPLANHMMWVLKDQGMVELGKWREFIREIYGVEVEGEEGGEEVALGQSEVHLRVEDAVEARMELDRAQHVHWYDEVDPLRDDGVELK